MEEPEAEQAETLSYRERIPEAIERILQLLEAEKLPAKHVYDGLLTIVGWAHDPAVIGEPSPPSLSEQYGLTAREVEILKHVADGESNREIARGLWVTEETVKFHLTRIFRKLNVSNRTEAARTYHEVMASAHGK